MKEAARHGLRVCVQAMDRAGFRAGPDRVDEDDHLRPLPGLHQRGAFTTGFEDTENAARLRFQSASQQTAHRIIAAQVVAQPDNQNVRSLH